MPREFPCPHCCTSNCDLGDIRIFSHLDWSRVAMSATRNCWWPLMWQLQKLLQHETFCPHCPTSPCDPANFLRSRIYENNFSHQLADKAPSSSNVDMSFIFYYIFYSPSTDDLWTDQGSPIILSVNHWCNNRLKVTHTATRICENDFDFYILFSIDRWSVERSRNTNSTLDRLMTDRPINDLHFRVAV